MRLASEVPSSSKILPTFTLLLSLFCSSFLCIPATRAEQGHLFLPNVVAMCWQDREGSWAGPHSTHGEADGCDVTEDSEKQDVMPGDGERGQHGAL